ncbi:MAG TPA: hypothetical protein VFJ02_20935 [Vicinamibacterales bacterium]|nr:hypothetical protein [Vicinamibacterales bacterium]
MRERERQRRSIFPQRLRLTVLTVHIMVSVGLLGDSAGFLAVAIRLASTDGVAAAAELVKVLQMFSVVFGIPLSFAALLSGLALGLGTRWGVFRYPWVIAKLMLIVSVMLVGGLVIGPAMAATLQGADASGRLIAAALYDVLALATTTGLSVFKPGGPLRRARALVASTSSAAR